MRKIQRPESPHHLLKHGRRIPPKLFGITQQENAYRTARFDELTGHDESIASVVAFAAEHPDALRLRIIGEDETGDGRAGVLH